MTTPSDKSSDEACKHWYVDCSQPVAWRYRLPKGTRWSLTDDSSGLMLQGWDVEPLYLHQAVPECGTTCPRCYGDGPSADCGLCNGTGTINAAGQVSNPASREPASSDKGSTLGAGDTDAGELPAPAAPSEGPTPRTAQALKDALAKCEGFPDESPAKPLLDALLETLVECSQNLELELDDSVERGAELLADCQAWQREAMTARSASGESDTYRAVADAFIELADAAQRAFAAVGLETGEWDGDDITKDVERGLVQAINDLAARSTSGAPPSDPLLVAIVENAARYCWLRDKSPNQYEHPIVVSQQRQPQGINYIGPIFGESLDKSIDAALSATQHTKEKS